MAVGTEDIDLPKMWHSIVCADRHFTELGDVEDKATTAIELHTLGWFILYDW